MSIHLPADRGADRDHGPARRRMGRIGGAYGYWAYQYKRIWRASIAQGFLNPALFLAAMGLGLGTLVNGHGSSTARLGGVSYLAFIAPGLLAASAMQMAALESMFPVMGGIKWIRTYHAMLASPLTVADVLYGHLLWMATRVALVSAVFVAVMAAFGAVQSPEVVAAIPVAVLTGMALAAPLAAYTASRETDQPLIAAFRFLVIPMFLFSGTFFPVAQLPEWVRPFAYATPLWHGVALSRSLSLGNASVAAGVGHVAYLGAWIAAGTFWGVRSFRRRLAA